MNIFKIIAVSTVTYVTGRLVEFGAVKLKDSLVSKKEESKASEEGKTSKKSSKKSEDSEGNG